MSKHAQSKILLYLGSKYYFIYFRDFCEFTSELAKIHESVFIHKNLSSKNIWNHGFTFFFIIIFILMFSLFCFLFFLLITSLYVQSNWTKELNGIYWNNKWEAFILFR